MMYQLGNKVPSVKGEHFIAPTACVIGDVTLDDHASVWFNTVIRADVDSIYIGKNTNIQDGSILHVDAGLPMHIGNNVTVGHKVMLHGCTVGDGSLIGMNAVVLNGASIGKGCLIGANTLIPENMVVPDGALVIGSPGRIKRQLEAQEQAFLLASADHYVKNAKRFVTDLKPVSP